MLVTSLTTLESNLQMLPRSQFQDVISTHQSLLRWVRPNDSTEVSKICSADFADVEEGVDAEGGEALEEKPLGHLLPNQGSHLGQQLQGERVS